MCALKRSGRVTCWGDASPRDVPGLEGVVEIATHFSEGCARLRAGGVECWAEKSAKTTRVAIDDAQSLFNTYGGFCAKRASNQVWCWPGVGAEPVRTPALEEGEPMATEGFFSCARRATGSIECWGINWSGQLGNGTLQDSRKPSPVLGWPAGPKEARAGKLELHATPPFAIAIEQRGRELRIDDHRVELLPAPFTLIFRFRSDRSTAFVVASHARSSFDAAVAGKLASAIPGLSETGMAEDMKNEQRILMMSDVAPSYWFYDDAQMHRFDDSCSEKESIIECRRTVATLWYSAERRLPLEKIKDPLFLVIASEREEPRPDGKRSEVHRIALELRFAR
jgi:hypothetical protein